MSAPASNRCRWAPIALLLLAAACSRNTGQGEAVVEQVVDEQGGLIEVTEGPVAGTAIEVPAGAVDGPTGFAIRNVFAEAVPGYLAVGPALRMQPRGQPFALPLTVTMPYLENTGGEVVVLARDSAGGIRELGPTSYDSTTATVAVRELAEFWVAERMFGGVATRTYFPVRNGNTWEFENDLVATLEQTTTEPNLGGERVYRFLFATPDRNFGFYIDQFIFSPVEWFGTFATMGGEDFQQLHDLALFLPARLTYGRPLEQTFPYEGFEPFGAAAPTYQGVALVEQLHEHGGAAVETPLGTFTDLITLSSQATFRDADGGERVLPYSITFANGKGPVAVELFGMRSLLVGGTVNGQPIAP